MTQPMKLTDTQKAIVDRAGKCGLILSDNISGPRVGGMLVNREDFAELVALRIFAPAYAFDWGTTYVLTELGKEAAKRK
jgi:hypothetical protein